MEEAIPVTVITGYLGAGKTTLLERIIKDSLEKGRRIAIVMNEFGRISIDGRIIEGKGIRIAELSGGCVCCSLSGEFASAVEELIGLADPEWIVVETTGVAEPSALAYDIKNNIKSLRLESIVTVVDADAISRFPVIGHTGREQIELADILIINKCDLIESGEEKKRVRPIIKDINPHASIIETSRCEMDIGSVFGAKKGMEAEKPGSITKNPHKGIPGAHETGFGSFVYSTERKMEHDKTIAFIENLPEGIYRAKGFIMTEKGSFLVDRAAGRTNKKEFKNDRTELVFIGESIGKIEKKIRESLDGCRIRP